MRTYTTRDGDSVDSICHQFYGRTIGTVDAVLEANTGLADRGPSLQAGLVLVLPDIPQPKTNRITLF